MPVEEKIQLKKVDAPPVPVTISDRARARFEIGAIDHLLWGLPSTADWSSQFPNGPSLEEKRRLLAEERDRLWASVDPEGAAAAGGQMTERAARSAAGRGPVGEREVGEKGARRLLRTITRDIRCTPIPEETVYVPPTAAYYATWTEPPQASWFEVDAFYADGDPRVLFFGLTCRDPNNDPWNRASVVASCAFWWEYELPVRVIDTEFEVGITGEMRADLDSRSNNVLGAGVWDAYMAGTVLFGDQAINATDPSLPISYHHDWQGPSLLFDSPDTWMTARRVVPAGQTARAFAIYALLLQVDRQVVRGSGLVQATDGLNQTTPDLRCTIRPV